MGQLTELAQIRKKRNQKRNMRKFVFLLIALIVVAVCMFTYEKIKEWDLRSKIDDVFASIGSGPGYPVDIIGGEAKKIFTVSGMPAIVNDSNAYLYNGKGKTVTNLQHGYNNPIATAEKGKMLLFDLGGTRMEVSSSSKTVYNKRMNRSILWGDIAESGDVAIATESENYVGEITVFNRFGDEVFKWYSAENIIMFVAISDDGSHLAVSTVNSKEGALVSTLYLFKVSTGTEVSRVEYVDELVMALEFKQGNHVTVLTDRAVRAMTVSNRIVGEFYYDGQPLHAFDIADSTYSLIALGDYRQNGKTTVYTLNDRMQPQSSIPCNKKLNALRVDSHGSYLTLEDGIEFYTLDGEAITTVETPMVRNSLMIGSDLYYTTHNRIYKEKVKRVLPSKNSLHNSRVQ